MVHSAHPIGMPRKIRAQKYGIRKAPPPFCAACPGNRRKLPKPTAEPATARMTPTRVPHCSLSEAMMGKLEEEPAELENPVDQATAGPAGGQPQLVIGYRLSEAQRGEQQFISPHLWGGPADSPRARGA